MVATMPTVHRLTPTVIVLCALFSGCTTDTSCPRVGESCTISCCIKDGLICLNSDRGGYCTKTCHCHGTAICTPSNFIDGCPQGSVCVTNAPDGTGECSVLCDTPPCSIGRYQCSPADAGTVTCTAVDAAPSDLSATPNG